MIYRKRVDAEEYKAIKNSKEKFEIRKADKDYRVGDVFIYCEFDNMEFTNREWKRRVTCVTHEKEGLKEGYVILSIESKSGRTGRKVISAKKFTGKQ